MKAGVRSIHLPLSELVIAALGTLAAFIIGRAFASGNPSLGVLILVATTSGVLLSVLSKQQL